MAVTGVDTDDAARPLMYRGDMTMTGSAQPTAEAIRHVHAVVDGSGSSFAIAMRLLPRERRQAMYALYAFCRAVDDIADDAGEEAEKRRRLAFWRNEVARICDGRPETRIGAVLAEAVAAFDLSRADFHAVIDGMETDAAPCLRLRDRAALTLYCDRVAGAVGRLANRIFGEPPESGDAVAAALGEALQLTNILRDVLEDAERNRLYLPLSMLAARGVGDAAEALDVIRDPGVADVCGVLAAEARARFDEAEAALARCGARRMRPAIIMKETYRRLLERLIVRGWRRLDVPVRVSRAEKLWIVLRHGVF